MAKWKRGEYGSEHLRLAQGVSASVSWAITGPRGYVARTSTGYTSEKHYSTPEEARQHVEAYLRELLTAALAKLGDSPKGEERP